MRDDIRELVQDIKSLSASQNDAPDDVAKDVAEVLFTAVNVLGNLAAEIESLESRLDRLREASR